MVHRKLFVLTCTLSGNRIWPIPFKTLPFMVLRPSSGYYCTCTLVCSLKFVLSPPQNNYHGGDLQLQYSVYIRVTKIMRITLFYLRATTLPNVPAWSLNDFLHKPPPHFWLKLVLKMGGHIIRRLQYMFGLMYLLGPIAPLLQYRSEFQSFNLIG